MLHYSMFGKATYDLVALLFLICVYMCVCYICMCVYTGLQCKKYFLLWVRAEMCLNVSVVDIGEPVNNFSQRSDRL